MPVVIFVLLWIFMGWIGMFGSTPRWVLKDESILVITGILFGIITGPFALILFLTPGSVLYKRSR